MKIEIFLILLLAGIVFLSGCIRQEEIPEKDKATSACINECKSRLNKGEDLNVGPCLLNPIPDLPNWVCDVAHSPRIPEIDNKPENQCSSFREGKAKHFVEVDPSCEFIQAW